MKKFMKFCAITALLLIVAGLVMGVAAVSLQGPDKIEEIVSSVTNDRVHVDLEDRDIRNWGVWIGDNVKENLDKWDSGKRYEVEEDMDFDPAFEILKGNVENSFAAEEVKSLKVKAGACHMAWKTSADGNFHIEACNVGKMQCFIKDGALCVNVVRKTAFQGKNDCEVTLSVPEGFRFRKADVELGAGSMEFDSLTADEAYFEVGAGQILCDGPLQADELELKIGAGEIRIGQAEVGMLDAEVGMGGLDFGGKIGKNADLECAMGNIKMKLTGSEKDYNYQLEAAMGGIEIGSYSVGGIAGEKTIDNSADRDMNLECSMGNIKVSFTE